MKKLIILFLLILVVGCTTAPNLAGTTKTTEDNQVIKDSIDLNVQTLFDKFNSLNSIKYQAKDGNTVEIQKNKIKVSYTNSRKVNEFFYFGLELDRDAKTAKVSCLTKCLSYDQPKVALLVDFNSYNIETVYDVLKSITSAKASQQGSVDILGRKTTMLETNIGKVWVDSYGIPLKVENGFEMVSVETNPKIEFGFSGFKEMTLEEYSKT